MATKAEIIKLIMIINEAYPDAKYTTSEQLVDLWVRILGNYENSVLCAATYKLISESPYVPKIADIANQVKSLATINQKTAAEAWGDVTAAIRKYGWNRQPEGRASLELRTRRVADMLGWQYLCASEDTMADRAHFMKMYDAVLNKDVAQVFLPKELSNIAKELGEKLNMNKHLPAVDTVKIEQRKAEIITKAIEMSKGGDKFE